MTAPLKPSIEDEKFASILEDHIQAVMPTEVHWSMVLCLDTSATETPIGTHVQGKAIVLGHGSRYRTALAMLEAGKMIIAEECGHQLGSD